MIQRDAQSTGAQKPRAQGEKNAGKGTGRSIRHNSNALPFLSSSRLEASESQIQFDVLVIAAKALIDTISYTKEDASEEKPCPVKLLIYIDESQEMTTSRQRIWADGRNVSSSFFIDHWQL